MQLTVIDVSLRKAYEEQLHYRANFDAVTDLPNRTLATDRLRQAITIARRRQQKVGVLFVDVDHFKKINDSFGHTIGDIFLRQLADRLREAVRREDTVARLGGDEFLVILPAVHARSDAVAVARKIIDDVAAPFLLEGQEAFVSVSIGVSIAPDDAEEAEVIMRNADSAMYQAKEKGRGTFGFFTQELDERLRKRMQLEAALRHALEREELTISFQPIFDIQKGAVIGAEALLRWTSAEFGVVSPEQFVQVAEDTGLIVPIGCWVLRTACREARRWTDESFDGMRLSVNVSSRQFRGPSLIEAVTEALDRNQLSPDCLQLEITETLLMEDISEIKHTLHRLEALGVRLAVDDFGTGYSSLSYLSRFPLDTVKIDRVFVSGVDQDPARAALVEAVIDIAERLNLDVVAEGVEREAELAFLAARNCRYAQGYLFSKPLPAEAFLRYLREAPALGPTPAPCRSPHAGGALPGAPAG
jgi:diguanylate cyclase (GGDEF)-like protein